MCKNSVSMLLFVSSLVMWTIKCRAVYLNVLNFFFFAHLMCGRVRTNVCVHCSSSSLSWDESVRVESNKKKLHEFQCVGPSSKVEKRKMNKFNTGTANIMLASYFTERQRKHTHEKCNCTLYRREREIWSSEQKSVCKTKANQMYTVTQIDYKGTHIYFSLLFFIPTLIHFLSIWIHAAWVQCDTHKFSSVQI